MKYGAHIFLWIEKWDSAQIKLMEQAKVLGLDAFEIATGDDVDFNPQLIRNKAEELSMDLFISPGGIWPMEVDISLPDTSMASKALDWHCKWIAAGAEAGAKAYTGALYGHPGRIIKASPDKDEYKRICENLNKMAAFAAQHNVKIVLEPMSHFRTHIANTAGQLLQLIEGTNHENLFVLMDTYHMATEVRDYAAAIHLLKDKLYCIHACENDRGVPGGGIIPWNSIGTALNEIGFDGYMVLESYNSTIRNGEFAYERGMFHNVCPDGDEFVRKGVGFLKSILIK